MNRVEAIEKILSDHPDAAVVFCNGLNAREAVHRFKSENHLYLLHAMGEALAVGAGLRLQRPDLEVVVIDGDGNAFMGASAGVWLPMEGLHHYILDNGVYETTGGQAVNWSRRFHHSHVIPINSGKIGAPNPPPPKEIYATFHQWCTRTKES